MSGPEPGAGPRRRIGPRWKARNRIPAPIFAEVRPPPVAGPRSSENPLDLGQRERLGDDRLDLVRAPAATISPAGGAAASAHCRSASDRSRGSDSIAGRTSSDLGDREAPRPSRRHPRHLHDEVRSRAQAAAAAELRRRPAQHDGRVEAGMGQRPSDHRRRQSRPPPARRRDPDASPKQAGRGPREDDARAIPAGRPPGDRDGSRHDPRAVHQQPGRLGGPTGGA